MIDIYDMSRPSVLKNVWIHLDSCSKVLKYFRLGNLSTCWVIFYFFINHIRIIFLSTTSHYIHYLCWQMLYFLMFTFGLFDILDISHYREHLFYLSCTCISLTSYATNFFIYILANRKFRRQLICKDRHGSRSSSSHKPVSRLVSAQSTS